MTDDKRSQEAEEVARHAEEVALSQLLACIDRFGELWDPDGAYEILARLVRKGQIRELEALVCECCGYCAGTAQREGGYRRHYARVPVRDSVTVWSHRSPESASVFTCAAPWRLHARIAALRQEG